ACSPIDPLARLAMRIRRLFMVNDKSSLGATWPKMSLTAGEALICPALLRIGAIDSLRKLFGRVRTRADRRTHGRRHACVERKRAGGTPALLRRVASHAAGFRDVGDGDASGARKAAESLRL